MCGCADLKYAAKTHNHSQYVTTKALNSTLADYYTKTEIDALLTALQDQIDALQAQTEPIGTIKIWPSDTIPAGWLLCDGTQYTSSLPSGYPLLYDAIDEMFHVGESNFVVPDLRGRVPTGKDTGQSEFNTMGETGGEKSVTLVEDQIPEHVHGIGDGTNPDNYAIWRNTGSGQLWAAPPSGTLFGGGTIQPAGGDQPHNNLSPYIVLNFIIKAQ